MVNIILKFKLAIAEILIFIFYRNRTFLVLPWILTFVYILLGSGTDVVAAEIREVLKIGKLSMLATNFP